MDWIAAASSSGEGPSDQLSRMKVFSLSEANALLPTVQGILESIQRSHRRVLAFADAAKRAAAGAEAGGGGMPVGERYVKALMELATSASSLESLGVQLKDYERGLIDFPSIREGRVVLLCWQLGEGEEVKWWHDVEAGFAGRHPL